MLMIHCTSLMLHLCSGVKDAVVDAVEELYLKSSSGVASMDPRQAAQNLVGLAQGSSLGVLDAAHAPTRLQSIEALERAWNHNELGCKFCHLSNFSEPSKPLSPNPYKRGETQC